MTDPVTIDGLDPFAQAQASDKLPVSRAGVAGSVTGEQIAEMVADYAFLADEEIVEMSPREREALGYFIADKRFGFDTRDGTQNHDAAWANIIAAAGSTGHIKLLPKSIYTFDDTIDTGTQNVSITGPGTVGFIPAAGDVAYAPSCMVKYIGGNGGATGLSWTEKNGAAIGGFVLDGQDKLTLVADFTHIQAVNALPMSIIGAGMRGSGIGTLYTKGTALRLSAASGSAPAHTSGFNSFPWLYLVGANGLEWLGYEASAGGDVTLTRIGMLLTVFGSHMGGIGINMDDCDANVAEFIWNFRSYSHSGPVYGDSDYDYGLVIGTRARKNVIGELHGMAAGVYVKTPADARFINKIRSYTTGDSHPLPTGPGVANLDYDVDLYGLSQGYRRRLPFYLGAGEQRFDAGTASPEGAISGPKGSVRLRSDPSAGGNVLYFKEAGTGATGWRGVRGRILANTTFYVRPDGSDSNDGTANDASHAFLTLQGAYNALAGLDFNGFTVTLQIQAGTWAAGLAIAKGWEGGGTLKLLGDSATPSNVTISVSAGSTIVVGAPVVGTLLLDGLKLANSGAGSALTVNARADVQYQNIEWGACGGNHVSVSAPGASVTQTGNDTISGGAQSHIALSNGSVAAGTSKTTTLTGTPAFSVAFVYASLTSAMQFAAMTYSGSATGVRYNANMNSVINSAGGGASYFPGNSAGVTSLNGTYN